jgi:urea carboxylase-associated protein 2
MKTISDDNILWCDQVPGGAHWSAVLRRGWSLRLTDVEGGANAAMLLYNHEDRSERYNMADTLKAQHTAFLTADCVCYSDMGRVLCSITADSCGWHDTLCGVSDEKTVSAKYGSRGYQEACNDYHKNGFDSLVNELGKHGLGPRDVVANINFFSKVAVDERGNLAFVPTHSPAGSYVDLRFEMNVLVVLSTCQHPLDPEPQYLPRPVELAVWDSGPAPSNDACRDRCAENQRGFQNTERLFGRVLGARL